MALKTKEEYFESIRRLQLSVYFMGERIKSVDHPMVRPSINSVGMSYELAQDPLYEALSTATSHLTGEKINRFCHIHQSPDDLGKKVKLLRLMGQKTASCFQRCAGLDAMNALSAITHEMDAELKTEYHQRFLNFLRIVQAEDQVVDAAMTDPKGDRSLSPSQQADPDLYLRVVKKDGKGIVVRGCKAHQTGAVNSHWIAVVPTTAMKEADKDYAVSFVTPSNAKGITYVYGRQSCDTRKLEGSAIDVGNSMFGGHETYIIFDDVFVPWEYVLMFGEAPYSGRLVEIFANYHRCSYGGCKVGVADVLIGATALMAEYNGTAKASHVKDKLIEMIHLSETCHGCALAAASEGSRHSSGGYLVNGLMANVCKLNITRFPIEIARLAQDLAGAVIGTTPSEKDFHAPDGIGELLQKYIKGVASIPWEDRVRCIRLIENITVGTGGVGFFTESIHGAGSPQAQRVMISRYGTLDRKKNMAKEIAGIRKPIEK
ncbi:MAG: 4-hydroxyphenylacetate 3-hydroxylase N-terminal domain-containing protein [Syntrophobacteraceae bacterium]|jgi:4-hydroxybutyryl-CoA dehydratase/vinylacetyl-CoA-Delta-isomerase